jgi:hypothetical protein
MGKFTVPFHGATETFLRGLIGTQETGCIEWPYGRNDKGYGLAVIGGKQRGAHNWMCRLTHGDPYLIWRHALHSCHNPACVNPNHLRWGTHAENMADRNRDGTSNRGERNGKTRLAADDVRAIRAAPPRLDPLMQRYGMSRHGISKIRSGKRWAHVQ